PPALALTAMPAPASAIVRETPESAPLKPAKPPAQQTPEPKWEGRWVLNKDKSHLFPDPKVQDFLKSIDKMTLTLESIPGGVKVTSELAGTRPGQMMQSAFTIPFGVRTDVKDIFIPASMFLPPGSVLVRSANPDSLEFLMREDTSSFSWGFYFQVSGDG